VSGNGKQPLNQGRVVAALDVGTSKIACLIGVVDGEGRLSVKGMGHRVSRGVKQGVIVDLDQASESICAAVDQAEQMADVTLEQVIVNLSAGTPTSHILDCNVTLNGSGVQQNHIDLALGQAEERIDLGDQALVHVFPACFSLDGVLGVSEPLGMYGKTLSVMTHAVAAKAGPIRNLETCIQRSHLGVARVVLSPYASGLATLVEDEKELGSACVDMGGGTTSLAVFVRGRMVHGEVLPTGGDDITQTIATGLLTPIAQAERLKILSGSAFATRSDEKEIIEIPKLGAGEGEERTRIPRAVLSRAIEPQLTALFETIRARLLACGFTGPQARRVVLTGGASQLTGARALAERVLEREVRLGRPAPIPGLPEAAHAAQFATLVGILKYVLLAPLEAGEQRVPRYVASTEKSKWSKLQYWLKANF
jgi:cell division protein FtsA